MRILDPLICAYDRFQDDEQSDRTFTKKSQKKRLPALHSDEGSTEASESVKLDGSSDSDDDLPRARFTKAEKGKGKAAIASPSKSAQKLVKMAKFLPSSKVNPLSHVQELFMIVSQMKAMLQILNDAPAEDKFMLISQSVQTQG